MKKPLPLFSSTRPVAPMSLKFQALNRTGIVGGLIR
jgi:hypothetical protein